MSILFTPCKINRLEVKNRFVRSATNDRMAAEDGKVTERLINYYGELAEGGIGLIVTGHAYTIKGGKGSPRMLGILNDDHVCGLSKLVDRVHAYGAKIAIQLNHVGGRSTRSLIGKVPLAPSRVRHPLFGDILPRALKTNEIEEIIDSFGQAARRAKDAGFDAVQLHGAHGYLISQFLSPLTNKRTDEWGGTVGDRMRFVAETYRNIRAFVGPEYPVFIKIGVADIQEEGLNIKDGCQIVSKLDSLGVDAFEISCGLSVGYESMRTKILHEEEEAYFLPYAKAARKVTTAPLILVGGIRSVKVMEKLINLGICDLVAMCRPFIREPDLVNKIMMGKTQKASCISCNRDCIGGESTYESAPPIKCFTDK